MDYTLNASLFICVLRDYLAAGAPDNLQRLFSGGSCGGYLRDTRLLLSSLQVLLLLEAQRLALLVLTPPADVSAVTDQQATVISYCLTRMDGRALAELPYGLSAAQFDHCGAPVVLRRVRSANGHPSVANNNFIGAGTVLALPLAY